MTSTATTALPAAADGGAARLEPIGDDPRQAARWRTLAEASQSRVVFQTPGWALLAKDHDVKRGRSALLLHGDGFALPLSVGREQGFTVARILAEPLAQYADCVGRAPSPAAFSAALETLRREAGVDLLVLRRVRDDSSLTPALDALGAGRGGEDVAPDIALCPTGPKPSATGSLSSEWKDALRRKRKLGAKSTLSFRVLDGGSEAASLIRLSLDWKAEWARERQIVSRLLAPEFREDFTALFAAPDGGAAVGVLDENGEPVSVTAGFVFANRFYDFFGAYRPDRGIEGVAKIAIAETVEWAGRSGYVSFDFLPPGDAYKLAWTKEATPVADRSLALSALGRLRAGLVDARLIPAAKRAIKALPPGLRGLVARVVR